MKRLLGGILLLFFAVFLFNPSATWAEDGLPDELSGSEALSGTTQMPGRIESTGTHFEVTNSDYLNISLDSSAEVKLRLESVPQMVTMFIESASGALSTQITLSGFAPETTYHKYEDNYHNHEPFTTDVNGTYTFTQDLSLPHVIFIKPRPSTKFIADDATGKDCTSIGLWDLTTKTCTLTTDLNQEIQIDSDGITLDGNGHLLTGSNTGNGVLVTGRSNVIIKNIGISGFTNGIYLYSSRSISLINNNASYNSNGIRLFLSDNNTLQDNIASHNYYSGIAIYYRSNYNTIIGNTASYNYQDTRYSEFAGIAVYGGSNNIVSNNAVSNQGFGISLSDNSHTVSGNHVSNNKLGIRSFFGSDNTIVDNVVESNGSGIMILGGSRFSLRGNIMTGNYSNFGVRGSSDQTLDHNIDTTNLVDGKPIYYIKDASNQTFDASTNAGTFYCINCTNVIIEGLTLTNNYLGIFLYKTNNSTIRNVNILGNLSYGGFVMHYSNNNTVYNNNFYKGCYISDSWGTGNVFNLPAPVGGNYFSDYDSAAEGCSDANGDGFCDAPYVRYSVKDNLPWVKGDGWRSDDTLPPTTTISTSGTSGNNGWYVSNVEATLTASDNEGGSGVAKTEYGFDSVNWNIYTIPFTISSEGTTRIYYKSTDNAGSPESAKSQEIKIDKTPPITSAAIAGTLGNNGWYLSDVTITVTATDSYSGIKEIHYIVDGVENVVSSDTAMFTLTVDGAHSIEYWAVDNAGIEGPRGSAPINRDAAAPVTTPITSGTAGSGGYYTSCVTATLQTTDTSSGTSATQYSLDGGQTWQAYAGQFEVCNTGSSDSVTVTYRSVSAAGKEEEPKILVIKIDKTSPTIVANISHAPNANGWHNTDVTVTFTCNDPVPGSGVASCQFPITLAMEGEGQVITGTVYDLAGNSATASVTLNIDKTAPIVNINAPFDGAEYTLGQVVTADWSTDDVLSGVDVATATLPIGSVVDTSTSGAKTFIVTAVDKAGNAITRTSAYYVRYTYSGVSQPINADGSSIFRLGSTVAVRFKLTDVSGHYITSAVASIYLAKITDNVIGTEEEAVSTSAASTGNQFRYDSTDNQYIFNLSTENMSAGTWQVRIELSDGSSKVAIISVR